MSRRKEANRAEAIVRGIGALIMLALLAAMVFALPHMVKGEDPRETMDIMFRMLIGYAVLGTIIGVVGLVVWFRVLKEKKPTQQHK